MIIALKVSEQDYPILEAWAKKYKMEPIEFTQKLFERMLNKQEIEHGSNKDKARAISKRKHGRPNLYVHDVEGILPRED